jgi:hypothetical protein
MMMRIVRSPCGAWAELHVFEQPNVQRGPALRQAIQDEIRCRGLLRDRSHGTKGTLPPSQVLLIDSVATFDIATGDLISLQETVHGPHPLREGVDICGPAIAYLTS